MTKRVLNKDEYLFNASANTIAFSEDLNLSQLLMIINLATNETIYNFACEGFGGTLSVNTLTLDVDTSGMSSLSELMIIIQEDEVEGGIGKLLQIIRKQTEVQSDMLEQLELCVKYLRKIYNPE